jgi:hypothetical protein
MGHNNLFQRQKVRFVDQTESRRQYNGRQSKHDLKTEIDQHIQAGLGYTRLDLTTTVWDNDVPPHGARHLGAGHGSLVTFGTHPACHVQSADFKEEWLCSVFRTEDSLFVLQMGGAVVVTIHWGSREHSSLQAGEVVRVPMSRHPVLLTVGDTLVTVAPSKYAPSAVPVGARALFFLKPYLLDVRVPPPEPFLPGYVDVRLPPPEPFLPGYVAVLVQAGLDVNRTDADGNTLLHTLCSRGWVDGVRALLATKRCEINATNHQGQTALWCALVRDDRPVTDPDTLPLVQKLLAEGAIFGRMADAKVRDVFHLAQEVYTYLWKPVGIMKDEPWRDTLDRLIYGRNWRSET